MIDLSSDVAVVTGAGSGIGEGIATLLAEAGAKVASMSVYAGAKAGVVAVTKSVAQEVGRKGMRANVVAPDATVTPGSSAFIRVDHRSSAVGQRRIHHALRAIMALRPIVL